MATEYTQAELDEFRSLVEDGESRSQLARIRSRLDMPHFIKRVGKKKCDAMFEAINREITTKGNCDE